VGLAKALGQQRGAGAAADDLAFYSRRQVDRFFASARDLRMSSEEIGAIYRRTEGGPRRFNCIA